MTQHIVLSYISYDNVWFGRICCIKQDSFHPWSFSFFFWPLWLIEQCKGEEKLSVGHSFGAFSMHPFKWLRAESHSWPIINTIIFLSIEDKAVMDMEQQALNRLC